MIKPLFALMISLLSLQITLAGKQQQQQQLPPLNCDTNNTQVKAKLNYLYNKMLEKYETDDIKLEATNFIYEYEKHCNVNKLEWSKFKKDIDILKRTKKQVKRVSKSMPEDDFERVARDPVERSESCTDTLNLTGPLSFENTKNQGSMGWCYAYSASDLVAHKLGRLVSPIYMAVNYNKEVGRSAEKKLNAVQSSLEGGYSHAAIISTLNSGGFCSNEDLPSTDNFLTQLSGMNPFSKLFVTIDGNNKLISYYLKNLEKLSAKFKKKKMSNADYASLQKKYGSSFPNLEIPEIGTIIEESQPHEVIEKLFAANCNKKLLVNKKITPETLNVAYLAPPTETRETLKAKIDETLDRKDVVSIAFSSRVLYNKSDKSGNDHHEVLLVGRKFDRTKNQCLYLVRNSYGPSCKNYDSSYECIKGHIWIPEETLFRSVDIVTYFSK